MSKHDKILRNIFSNWSGFAVNALVMLALTPFVLTQLGIERYGVWILINSVIGYYGMLDLGFRAGVNQFLIRSIAADDFDQANVVFNSALAALAVIGGVIALLTIPATLFVPGLLDMPAPSQIEASYSILIVGMAAAIQVFFSPFSAIFVAEQRFDLLTAIAVSMRLASAAGVVFCLYMGYGLIGLAAASALATVGGCIIRAIVSRKLLPSLRFSLRLISAATLRGIGSFGLWNFLTSMVEYFYLNFIPILIAIFMPAAAVGHYALAAGLWLQLSNLFRPIGTVLYPVAAELNVRGESKSVERLYIVGTRLMLLIVIPVVLIAYVWADDFYRLWVGAEFISGEPFVKVSTLLRAMLIAVVIAYTVNIAGQIMMGAGHIRLIAIAQVCGATTAISLIVLLTDSMGLTAVVTAIVAGYVISDIVLIPRFLKKTLGLSFITFIRRAAPRLVMTGAILYASNTLIHSVFAEDTWMQLIGQGVLAAACAILAVTFVGLTRDERMEFLLPLLTKLFRIRQQTRT